MLVLHREGLPGVDTAGTTQPWPRGHRLRRLPIREDGGCGYRAGDEAQRGAESSDPINSHRDRHDVDEDEPIFSLVEDLVIAEWKTLRNTHVNRPRALLRSIIIDAISTVADKSPEAAGVIWHTAVSPHKHAQIRLGKEASLVTALVQRAAIAAEQAAVMRAGMAAPGSKKRRRIKTSTDVSALELLTEITDDELVTDIARSAGPQNPEGESLSDPNPHWPNQGQPWSQQFVPRMTDALVKTVNLGTKRLADLLSENLSAYLAALEQRLSEQVHQAEAIRNEVAGFQQAGRMRLDVLWWSEARYSPSLARGYRELHSAVAAIVMALDLSNIIPALAPASVAYVLGESVASLSRNSSEGVTQPLESLLTVLAEDDTDFGEQLPNATSYQGRLPLFELIAEAAGGTIVSAEAVRSRAGVDPSLQLSMAEFAMWVFHDLQARRLVEALQ